MSWSSRKQNCVALSSTEAVFVALSEACQEVCWLRRLLEDMEQNLNSPTVMHEDSQSCLKCIEEQKISNRTKHIDTRIMSKGSKDGEMRVLSNGTDAGRLTDEATIACQAQIASGNVWIK